MLKILSKLFTPKNLLRLLSIAGAVRNKILNKKNQNTMSEVGGIIAGGMAKVFAKRFAALIRKVKPEETRKALCITLYVPIDGELEKITEQTKTKFDDAGVYALKTAIETIAKEDGFALPNIDND